jgi:hypothetical protein
MMNSSFKLEDVLDALVHEEPEPTYDALTRWSALYPEHRDALARFFVTWAMQSNGLGEPAINEESLANRTVSYALNAIHEIQGPSQRSPETLFVAARRAQLAPEQLATQAELDDSIVTKLNRRLIRDVPRLCIDRLSIVLKISREQVITMVIGPPAHAVGARYKSLNKPAPVIEDFLTAVRNSGLAPEAQRFWADVLARERNSTE